MKKQWSTVLIIALILVVVIFSVLNVDPVNINFGFTTVEIPLVVVIIGTLLIGVLIAVMWSTTIIVRERNTQKKLNQKLDNLQAENNAEKQELEKKYRDEKQELQLSLDNVNAEKRELNRRIHNMETNRTINKNEVNNI